MPYIYWIVPLLLATVHSTQNHSILQPPCSDLLQTRKPIEYPVDSSWLEYLRSVYNTNDSAKLNMDIGELNFMYRNGPVETSAPDWHHRKPISALDNDWGDTYFRYSDKTYLSHEWAEVSRYSTTYLQKFRGAKDEWIEGLSQGMSGKYSSEQGKVPYGCWFNLAKGSGIFVNVGKTIVSPRKYEYTLYAMLGLSSKGCPMDSAEHEHARHENCYDRYLCSAALSKGVRSIQIMDHSEMVICADACATQPLHHTCPELELRSGVDASQPCSCSNDKYLLNCDGNGAQNTTNTATPSSDTVQSANGVNKAFIDPTRRAQTQAQLLSDPPRRRTCVPRHPSGPSEAAFNLTLAFTAGMLHLTDTVLPKLHRALKRYPSSETVLLDVGGGAVSANSKPPPTSTHAGAAMKALSAVMLGALNNTVGNIGNSNNTGIERRRLYGHHHHHHHDQDRDEEEDERDERREREEQEHYIPDFDRRPDLHHPDHHHDHNHDYDRDREHDHDHDRDRDREHHTPSAAASGDPVYGALFEAGYRAVGAHISYAALQPSPLLPVLTMGVYGAYGGQRSALVVAGNSIRVGVIAHSVHAANETQTMHELRVQQIQDEAMCLKKMGSSLVVLMVSHGDIAALRRVATSTKGYIDAILSAHPVSYTCQGRWQSDESGVLIVQIDSAPNSVGVLSVVRDSAGYAFRSDIMRV